MEELVGLIPAAGKGVRLGLPYPKELYPIIRNNRYKPVSQFVLENLTNAGVEHIVFVINETKHQLMGFFGNGSRFGCNISYVIQEQREGNDQSTSPGLAHALNSAYHLIKGKTVCFGMADTIMAPQDLFARTLQQQHTDAAFILGMFRTQRPEKFGMVEMDEKCNVLKIIDKPAKTHLEYMWGFIVWRPIFTEHLYNCIQAGIYDFAQVMNQALQVGMKAQGVIMENGSYSDLGTYEEIDELEKLYRA